MFNILLYIPVPPVYGRGLVQDVGLCLSGGLADLLHALLTCTRDGASDVDEPRVHSDVVKLQVITHLYATAKLKKRHDYVFKITAFVVQFM